MTVEVASGAPVKVSNEVRKTDLRGFTTNSVPEPPQLPPGFVEFYAPLHSRFTPWQQELVEKRKRVLADAHAGKLPTYLPPSEATTTDWKIQLPEWAKDQRNQMTGPADDAELCVKMLNSGAPGVMLDLEDSMANTWPHLTTGIRNLLAALAGTLSYFDARRNRQVAIKLSDTVIWLRPRGLHLNQAGLFEDCEELM